MTAELCQQNQVWEQSVQRLYVGTESLLGFTEFSTMTGWTAFGAWWVVVVVVQSPNFIIRCESVSQNAEVWGSCPLFVFTFSCSYVLWKAFVLKKTIGGLNMYYNSYNMPCFCPSLVLTAATWCTRTWWWQSVSMISSLSASTSADCAMERKLIECNAAQACQVWIHTVQLKLTFCDVC